MGSHISCLGATLIPSKLFLALLCGKGDAQAVETNEWHIRPAIFFEDNLSINLLSDRDLVPRLVDRPKLIIVTRKRINAIWSGGDSTTWHPNFLEETPPIYIEAVTSSASALHPLHQVLPPCCLSNFPAISTFTRTYVLVFPSCSLASCSLVGIWRYIKRRFWTHLLNVNSEKVPTWFLSLEKNSSWQWGRVLIDFHHQNTSKYCTGHGSQVM